MVGTSSGLVPIRVAFSKAKKGRSTKEHETARKKAVVRDPSCNFVDRDPDQRNIKLQSDPAARHHLSDFAFLPGQTRQAEPATETPPNLTGRGVSKSTPGFS